MGKGASETKDTVLKGSGLKRPRPTSYAAARNNGRRPTLGLELCGIHSRRRDERSIYFWGIGFGYGEGGGWMCTFYDSGMLTIGREDGLYNHRESE
jgi:hypothetical protein